MRWPGGGLFSFPAIRGSLAERVSNDEALSILSECKEAGLAQIGDILYERHAGEIRAYKLVA